MDCFRLPSDPVLRNRSTFIVDLREDLSYVDSPTPLQILDTKVETSTVKRRRRIPVKEFRVAEIALEPSELAVAVDLKPSPENSKSLFCR